MPNNWISHVKQFAQDNNIKYRDALKQAKESYKGGSLQSGYIQKMVAMKDPKFELLLVNNPSMDLKKRYGQPAPAQEIGHPAPQPVVEPVGLQNVTHELHYDDYNVSNTHQKEKTKRNKQNKNPTERSLELAEDKANKERELKQKQLDHLLQLKLDLAEYKKAFFKIEDQFDKDLREMRHSKLKLSKKDEMEQKMIVECNKNKSELKAKYRELLNYKQKHKLGDFNMFLRHLNNEIKKL